MFTDYMIDAATTRKQTEEARARMAITERKRIYRLIKQHANDGNYSIGFKFDFNIKRSDEETIIKELKDLGYIIHKTLNVYTPYTISW